MSDNWLILVPADPNWQPTREAAETTVALLESLIGPTDKITPEWSDEVQFIHPFSNWSGVECPFCRTNLEEWFHEAALDDWEDSKYTRLECVTPCCSSPTSLNELHFVWPAAFGRFALEVMNPDADTTPEQERQLSDSIGAPLRKVWRHL